ncbi:MAG: aldolase/citrate lyase family protein [Planctomycetes bacterium]|nr:aldolase/citrate lyase family protein [Planctomycetota bacterium]
MAMPIKKKLRAGKSALGTMLTLISNPNIAYILKNAGFDFVFIDCEHGPYSFREVSNMTALCRALDLGVIIRVPQPDRESIQKYSDMGIDGIMLPMVESAKDAAAAAAYGRYIPRGNRGMGLGPIVDYKTGLDLVEVIKGINDDYIILTQIETRAGVENIDKIMKVDGVDGCFFGVYDMSISYGKPGRIYDPLFRKNIKKVLASAKKNGKILGHHFFGYQDLEWGLEQGVQLAAWHTDVSALQTFYKTDADKIKALPGFKL